MVGCAERGGKVRTPDHQCRHIDTERSDRAALFYCRRPSCDQGGGSTRVAAGGVGEADSELCQHFPQLPLRRRCHLPRVLEHLVGVERASGVE